MSLRRFFIFFLLFLFCRETRRGRGRRPGRFSLFEGCYGGGWERGGELVGDDDARNGISVSKGTFVPLES